MAHRDNQTDTTRKGTVAFIVDMRPPTLLEQSLDGGYSRTTKPVGDARTAGPEIQTTGGRGMGDAVDAIRIGATGRKY